MELPMPVDDLVPQRPPMRVVDALLAAGDGWVECAATVAPGSPFANEDGTVDGVALIEMVAQATAAYEAFRQKRSGDGRIKGLFLGARGFCILGAARVGETLRVCARKEAEFSGFGVGRGEVLRGEECLARGELKFWHD